MQKGLKFFEKATDKRDEKKEQRQANKEVKETRRPKTTSSSFGSNIKRAGCPENNKIHGGIPWHW